MNASLVATLHSGSRVQAPAGGFPGRVHLWCARRGNELTLFLLFMLFILFILT